MNPLLIPHSDRAVQEYRARSGATNTYWLNELTKYVKSQGLWSNFRLYPFVNRTGAGTGSVGYGLGGLTSNEMTLVNGPTWGSDGVAFASASSQYGTIADFLGSETLTCFLRTTKTDVGSSDQYMLSQWDFGDNNRSVALAQRGTFSGDPVTAFRSSDGTFSTGGEAYGGDKTGIGSDSCFVVQWVNAGGRALWVNKSSQTLSLDAGSAQTAKYNTSKDVLLSASLNNGSDAGHADQTTHALAFLTGTVTTDQRETITDMINEL